MQATQSTLALMAPCRTCNCHPNRLGYLLLSLLCCFQCLISNYFEIIVYVFIIIIIISIHLSINSSRQVQPHADIVPVVQHAYALDQHGQAQLPAMLDPQLTTMPDTALNQTAHLALPAGHCSDGCRWQSQEHAEVSHVLGIDKDEKGIIISHTAQLQQQSLQQKTNSCNFNKQTATQHIVLDDKTTTEQLQSHSPYIMPSALLWYAYFSLAHTSSTKRMVITVLSAPSWK